MQKGPELPSCMMAQEEISEEPVKEAQIQPEEELKEIDLRTELGSRKPVFISSQLVAQESRDGTRIHTWGGQSLKPKKNS